MHIGEYHRVTEITAEALLAFVAILLVLLFQLICFGIYKFRNRGGKQTPTPAPTNAEPNSASMAYHPNNSLQTLPQYQAPGVSGAPNGSGGPNGSGEPSGAQVCELDPPPPYVERPADAHIRE